VGVFEYAYVTISMPCGGTIEATFGCPLEGLFSQVFYKFYLNEPGIFDVVIDSNYKKGLVNPNSGISNGTGRYQQIFDGSSRKAYRFNSNGGQLNLPQFSTETPLLIGNSITNNGAGDNAIVKSLSVMNDNKILVGGEFTMYNDTPVNNLVKLNSDGSLNSTLIQNSLVGVVNSIFVNSDGSSLISGEFNLTGYTTSYTNLIRLTNKGELDTTFKVGNGFNGPVNVAKTLGDKSIIVGGKFSEFQTRPSKGLVRLNSDGTLLTNYKGGFNTSSIYTPNVSDIIEYSNGTLLIVGGDSDSNSWLSTFQGVNIPTNIVKLKSNGYADQTFSATTGFDGYVNSVSIQFDGKVLVGGNFDCYEDSNGSHCGLSGLTRINSNGTIDDTFPDLAAFDGTIVKTFVKPNSLELYVGGEFDTPYDKLVKIYAGGQYQLYEFTGCNGTLGFVYLPNTPTGSVVKARINESTVVCGFVGNIVQSGDTNIFYSEGSTYYSSCNECNEVYQAKLLVRQAGKPDYVVNRTMSESQIDKVLADGPIFSTGGPEIYEILDFWLGSEEETEILPAPTPSVTVSPTITVTKTITPTITVTNTGTPATTPTNTTTITVTKTVTPTYSQTLTLTPTITSTITNTLTITPTAACVCLELSNTGVTTTTVALNSCYGYKVVIDILPSKTVKYCCSSVISSDPSIVITSNGPCNGGVCPPTPTPTPTNSLTPTITPTNTITPTKTVTPTAQPKSFISVWSGSSVTLPYNGVGTYTGTIDWGDGSVSANTFANRTHTYSGSGTWTITITGTITGWATTNAPTENNKLLEIKQWNNVRNVFGQAASFSGCSNLVLTGVTDTYDFDGIDNTTNMFANCTSITTINNISSWNLSGVTNLGNMFNGCTNFNDNITTWDVSNVTSLSNMLYSANSFNQDLGSWDVSNVSGFSDFMAYCGISTLNYDNTLIGWSSLTLQTGRYFGAYGLTYTSAGAGGTARSSIISNYSWSFVGDTGV
jgi:surface protein